MRTVMFCIVLGCTTLLCGQQSTVISGVVKDKLSERPIQNAVLTLDGLSQEFFATSDGNFLIDTHQLGERTVTISVPDFLPRRFSVDLNGESIDLGTIFLEKDVLMEKTDNLVTLTENDLSDDDEIISGSFGLLQATRDVFLSRAAFDFGQAFFRIRGYDSRNGNVLINGIPMNKFFDGRPQWNNWGGLNDVTRNQEFTNGLALNHYTFGGMLGNTNIDTRPSGMRPGIRLSSSLSNRTYMGRIMATYSSGVNKNGLAYTVSSSRRWAKSGYIEGTLYDAYSFFGALEYRLNPQNSLLLTSVLAKNRRGRSSAITEETFNMVGNTYNPYWGDHDGEIRNSREREIFEPFFMLNYVLKSEKTRWTTGIAYQFGTNARSRLGYFDAANPDPTYYRYLPSFYLNSSIGADFTNAALAKEGFLSNSQIQWESLYEANSGSQGNGRAAYMLYDDVVMDTRLSASSSFGYDINEKIHVGGGLNYSVLSSSNFARIKDLLGADFHQDVDAFSNTLNDVNGSATKTEDEKFGYQYNLNASDLTGFGQIKIDMGKWNSFVSATITNFGVQRDGLFQNERFLNNSFGKSEKVTFSNLGFKAGASYFFTGRHGVTLNGAMLDRAPTIQNVFINPRENNEVVPEVQSENIATADFTYFIRLPDLKGRISAFYTRFMNTTDINFFYVDSGLGSDFVQEVITHLDRLHKGIEMGLEYEVSSQVKLSLVGNLAQYVYASDPSVQINFDTAGAEEDLINLEGNVDLGIAQLKNLKLAQGPQTAFAFGVEYRNPKYWWAGATTNYLADNYINVSTITRTQSFVLDPETGERFPDATDENVAQLLKQRKLDDFYLLNLVGGKSWLINKKYISAFVSVNNAFNEVFRTGGYEQSRNGNYRQLQQDNLSGTPSFGPKYWYGYGRTYFLNFAISF